MTPPSRDFEGRFDVILTAMLWGTLLLGFIVSTVRIGLEPRVVSAGFAAGAFVVTMQAVPIRFRERSIIGEPLAVTGITIALIAIALTGGADSPYILFSVTPTLYAAGRFGARIGFEVAMLAIFGLVVVGATLEQELLSGSLLIAAGLHLVIAASFSQARRLLLTQRAETAALREASEATLIRIERLESAHSLLLRLTSLTETVEMNPVSVGREALEQLSNLDYTSATISMSGDHGPVVVASDGTQQPGDERSTFPLTNADREVGHVVLTRRLPWTADERAFVTSSLRPVALAFDNILLLRDFARRAVQEERTRLARELHDEIGPSLASLGLALDLALIQYPTEPELAGHLEGLRGSVEKLVEEVRNTVADLRRPERLSVIQQARALAAEADGSGPVVAINIDERRPPRPAIAPELTAILNEAVRNALEHANAKEIRIEGYVDHGNGRITVRDDGDGFQPAAVEGKHFGLIGMRERAARIDASVRIESFPDAGTLVTIDWGAA